MSEVIGTEEWGNVSHNFHGCVTAVLPTEGNSTSLVSECTYGCSTETNPQNPVEVLLVHSQEVTVVLSQDNGGSTRGVINKSELSKVISFMKSANHTLCSTKCGPVTDQERSNLCSGSCYIQIGGC